MAEGSIGNMKLPDYDVEYLLFGTLLVIGNKLQVLGDNFFEEITAKQWFVLCMLEIFGDRHPTLKELSEAMGSSHQNVKQLVLKLEKKGYLQLREDEEDRRKMRIIATQQTKVLAQKYGEKQQEFMKNLFRDMDNKDLSGTLRTLTKLIENMEG